MDQDKLWLPDNRLDNFFTDIHKYLRFRRSYYTLQEYGLECGRSDGETGVWLGVGTPARKICALGSACPRWVTMHGFAFECKC
jgi:lipoyl(octanoyl) transferase